MAKGFTYFCTDQYGHTYTRYSAGHGEAVYTFACVRSEVGDPDPVGKTQVSYSAQRGPAAAFAAKWNGRPFKPWGRSPGGTYTGEVVPVRAYPGRHAVEPT